MAKKTTLPASVTKKQMPSKPASSGGRTPPKSGAGAPPWVTRAAKKGSAVQRTARKSGGK
jgi:hypothetical protein